MSDGEINPNSCIFCGKNIKTRQRFIMELEIDEDKGKFQHGGNSHKECFMKKAREEAYDEILKLCEDNEDYGRVGEGSNQSGIMFISSEIEKLKSGSEKKFKCNTARPPAKRKVKNDE